MGNVATLSQALEASKDYEMYFIMTSNIDDDNDVVNSATSSTISNNNKNDAAITSFTPSIIDGINRNPYAAWEWAMINRVAQRYDTAAEIHKLASNAFDEIGDKPRSIICTLDRGIDMASGLGGGDGSSSSSSKQQLAQTTKLLEDAIESDVNVEGRDVELLQRLVGKEGEARTVLAGLQWGTNSNKAAAETQFGTACTRLDQLNADYNRRNELNQGRSSTIKPSGVGLGYSIDDLPGAESASCSRFKNDKYIDEKLVWSSSLRSKVANFLNIK